VRSYFVDYVSQENQSVAAARNRASGKPGVKGAPVERTFGMLKGQKGQEDVKKSILKVAVDSA
jgi:hypothetical protein